MPLIYEAMGLPPDPTWTFPRADLPLTWDQWVHEYRNEFQQRGIDAVWVTAQLDGPSHLPCDVQAEMIGYLLELRVPHHPALAGNHLSEWAAARQREAQPAQVERSLSDHTIQSYVPQLGKKAGGQMLEDYSLDRTLGKGGFATVKLARRRSTGKTVALKIIELAPKVSAMVRREHAAMRQVQHKNVIRLERTVTNVPYPRENGEVRKVLLFELELAPGGELFDYLATGGAFPEPVARAYFKQMLLGLAECHRMGVYHRDIKPDNILLNENFQLKIVDFGLAALNPANKPLRTMCGTPSYQAPEIIMGQPYQGDKADVWSAGVVLFNMLVGSSPFGTAAPGDWFFNAIACKRHDQFWATHQRPPAPMVHEEAQDFLNSIFTVGGDERKTVAELLNHRWIECGSQTYPEARVYEGATRPATPLPTNEALAAFMAARKAVIDENRCEKGAAAASEAAGYGTCQIGQATGGG